MASRPRGFTPRVVSHLSAIVGVVLFSLVALSRSQGLCFSLITFPSRLAPLRAVHTRPTRCDATKLSCRVGVGGVNWLLCK